MEQYQLGEMEQRFAQLIWAHEPVSSRKLTELCEQAFSWKRTTTYTMLKRLCNRGIFVNDKGTVRAKMTREEFGAARGEQLLQEQFGGSLPLFIAAFTRRNKLSDKEIAQLRQLIEQHQED